MMLVAAATRCIPSSAACRSRVFAASQSVLNSAASSLPDATRRSPCASASPHLLSFVRSMSSSDLPYHLVVGMPALSPTMETGTIASWSISEGDRFTAGDPLAEIETDKATIAFEAQDDGVVAKLLVEAGGGEVKVGVPIMVTVEEEEDVAAFKDFVLEESSAAAEEPAAAAAPEHAAPAEEKKEEAPAAVAAAPAPVPEAAPVPPPPAVAAAAAPPAPSPAEAAPEVTAATPAAPTVGPTWGNLARVASPIAKTLSAEQKAYVEKYGSTGQIPL